MKTLLAFLLFVISAALPAQEAPEARSALIIGVGKYADRYFTRLEAPEADARAMAEKLTALGFDVTLRLNATRKEMLDATDAFGAKLAERKGVGLFYFSGHGSSKPDEADPNFLIPADSRISSREDLPQEAFNAQRVANRMKEAGNRLNLVFLDACRNNSLPSRSKDAVGGLAAMRGASGLMFFFATQPNQIALEDSDNKRSLFTAALLKHIQTPGLSFMDMMADVTAETEIMSLGDGGTFKQSPFMAGTLSGRFAFVPGKGAPVKVGAPAAALSSASPPSIESAELGIVAQGSFVAGQTFKSGDLLTLRLRVGRPCHLRVLYQSANGEITRLFPEAESASGQIPAGNDVLIPDPAAITAGKGQAFQLVHDSGKNSPLEERIHIQISDEAFTDEGSMRTASVPYRVYPRAGLAEVRRRGITILEGLSASAAQARMNALLSERTLPLIINP